MGTFSPANSSFAGNSTGVNKWVPIESGWLRDELEQAVRKEKRKKENKKISLKNFGDFSMCIIIFSEFDNLQK